MKIQESFSRLETTINSYSKSYTNRALILGALNSKEVIIKNYSDSEDSEYLIKALQALGLDLLIKTSEIIIHNSIYDLPKKEKIKIEIGEGGTTIRFFLFLICMIDQEVELIANERFFERPIDHYLELLNSLGAVVSVKDNVIYKSEKIRKEKISIDCSQTTQFASAALLCLGEKYIELNHLASSKKYLDLTLKIIKKRSTQVFDVPIDMSSLGYLIAYGLIINDIHIKNVTSIDEQQADSYLFKILKKLGADYTLSKNGLTVRKLEEKDLKLVLDGSEFLDLIPTLCFIFSYISGVYKIQNIGNLANKESDRLKGITYLLDTFEVKYQLSSGELLIQSSESTRIKKEITLNPKYDHRMVMTGILYLMANSGGDIARTDAINKSYKSFFKDFKITQ
jgi:3-phosphoshikimate 1-carboxyvinyltransferase